MSRVDHIIGVMDCCVSLGLCLKCIVNWFCKMSNKNRHFPGIEFVLWFFQWISVHFRRNSYNLQIVSILSRYILKLNKLFFF